MANEKLIFPIGFDLEEGVKKAGRDWKNHYRKRLQDAIDSRPLKVKIDFESKGIDTKEFKRWMVLSREAEKLERERIKNAKEWQKVSDQASMAETRRANATNESNARIERQNRKAEASEKRKRDAVERTNASYKTQSSYLSRLMQRMVAYASVAQAFSFIRNIREVTAEFELQRVALGSIIGDLNEANAMFEQIKAAAVKSPFQIKELVTYTKQLAAYKIETDELFETTQRLADISAGLGVGMERLVLAYGQIRATGYLRASEVRQLTEAGIPIVEELAKKMSELRGETVSAAEVMGMISERAISFGMVKEVFDDMTSAGGMFYKMQEKQAETLQGQWSNLQDSIAIMYEEIGNTEGVNNAIKGSISLVKSLAENWQLLGNILKITAYQYGAMYAASLFIPRLVQSTKLLQMAEEAHAKAKKMSNVATQRGNAIMAFSAKQTRIYAYWMRQAANAHTMFGRGVKRLAAMFLGGGWIGAVIGVLTVAVSWFISARKEAKRLNEELAKIGTEGALQTDQSVRNFERLAKAIRESADGSARQTEALEEMKRAYGEFLPSQDESIINLVREKDGYNAVTQAIREKIALQIQEQKLNTIASEYGSQFAKWEEKLKESWFLKDFSKEEISLIIADIKNAVNEGLIASTNDIEDNMMKVRDIVRNITGSTLSQEALYRLFEGGLLYKGYITELIRVQENYNSQIQDVENSMESATGSLGKYTRAYKGFKEELQDVTGTGEKFSFEWNESKTKEEIKAYNKFIGDLLAKEGIKFDIGEAIDFKGLYEALGDNYPQLKQVVAKIQKEYEKLIPTDITRLANDKLQEYADKVGVSMDDVKEHLKTNEQSTEDWANGLKDAYESAEKKLAEYKKSQEAFVEQGAPFRDWSEDIEEITKEMDVLKLLMDFFEEFLPQSGGGKKTNPRIALLNEELSTVEKIYKEYQELRKFMRDDDARARIADMFEDVNLTMLSQALSPTEMRAQLQKALDEAKKMGDKAQILEFEYRLGKFDADEAQRQLEESMRDLSDKISRTKTAKEFFDRMLGLTGDKQLSATLTMSVYGTTGDDLKSALVKQVRGAFAGQDLSKAINTDLNSIDLSALREIYNNLPEDFQEKQKQSMKQVLDMLEKGQNDLASNFAKLLMDYDEMEQKRVTITQKATQEIATLEDGLQAQIEGIRQNEEIVDKDSAIAQAKARAEAVRKAILAREKLELSKLSPEYIRFFSSINAMAMETANSTRTQLRRALFEAFEQGGISAEELRKELKAIDTQFNKLNENASIFASYTTGGFDAMVAKLRESADELDAMAIKMKGMKSLNDLDDSEQTFINRMLNVFGDKGQKSLSDLASSFNGDMSQMGDAVADVGSKMQGMFSGAMGALSIVDMIIKAVHQSIEAIQQVLDQINSMRSEDNQVGDWFKYISDFDKYVMSGWENLKSGNIAGALADTAGSIISIFQNIQSDKLKRLDDDIERQQELLDNLAYSYERLEKAQEKAFGNDYISNYQRQLANLEAQVEAYEKQLELERSKGKKADEEKIKEYQNQIRDTKDAIKDMQSELSEHFLGTDLTSAARDFANAWIDAYKEFGNTTDAMKEKFQDMIQNMIVESFAARIIQTALADVFKEIDKSMSDGMFDMSEAAKVTALTNTAIGNIDVGMTNLMNALAQAGISVRGMGSDLTGISRDIATASEESILGLAAGINTQNFYISQVPTKLDTIIGLLRGDGAMPQGSAMTLQDVMIAQNQFLSHLPTIAQHTAETVAECKQIVAETRRTADALDRVIKPKGTQTTHTLNTTIN